MNVVKSSYRQNITDTCLYLVRRTHYRMKMNELDDFIGNWRKLRQAEKEANLVLSTLAGIAWATLSA